MKRWLVLMSVLVCLSGCAHKVLMSQLGIVSGFGIDKIEDRYRLTAQVVNPSSIAGNQHDTLSIFSVSAGAIINLIANYFFIPLYQGLGAVLGTVLAEGVVCIIQMFMTRDVVNYRRYLKYTFIFCFIGEAMFLVLQMIHVQNSFVNIIVSMTVGVVIYSILSGIYFIKFEGMSIKNIKNRMRGNKNV